jgi:predicted amidohydrolase YtcJ
MSMHFRTAKDPAAELPQCRRRVKPTKTFPTLVTGIKIFADGVVEYPFTDRQPHQTVPKHHANGDLLFDPKKFAELRQPRTSGPDHTCACHRDGAVKAGLDGIAAARKANGNSGLPHSLT